MKHTSKFLAFILTLAMAMGLLAAMAVPASAATQCFVCEGVCFYQCSRCIGKGAYYYCTVHTDLRWETPRSCDQCGDGIPVPLMSPCDNGCADDGSGRFVTACTFCNGLGVIDQAPSAPKNLALTPGDKKITMTWEAPDDDGGSPITGYKVQRGIEGIDDEVVKVDVGPDVFTYTWSSLQNGRTYAFYVWAVNGVGESIGMLYGGCEPDGPEPPPNTFKLWGIQTTYDKGLWYNWILLIVCFGWIWMAF